MQPVRKQIVYDENQRPVQVLIPYDDWRRIEAVLQDIESSNAPALMEFYGKINFEGDPVEIQQRMRAEWPD